MKNIINYIKNYTNTDPKVGVVLGSGLQKLSSYLNDKKIIKYSEIPSFIDTTIDGHAGEFVVGRVAETNLDVIFANGRFHYYEGLDYDKTHIIIDIFHGLGCSHIITTNSSGCLEKLWSPGDIMIISSHIDMTFRNSATKLTIKSGKQYYSSELMEIASRCMKDLNLPLREGRYGWMLGPSYETPSEIKMMQDLSIQAVGMSTVPEIERAHELKLRLLAIACLTNYAVGISKNPLTHNEVVSQANKSSMIFADLILNIMRQIDLA